MIKNETVIFTGFANPQDNLPCLSREEKGILDALNPLESKQLIKKHLHRKDLDVKSYFDFLSTWENQLSIFHFAGHANSTKLRFQDNAVFFGAIAEELVDRNKESLQLVFLNGCSTKAHVQTLFEQGVQAVIATSANVKDELAADLAICFYQNMAKGDNIEKAFKSGLRYLQSVQQLNSQHRILGQPEEYRSSIHFSRQAPEHLPWGLYVNTSNALQYAIVQKSTSPKNVTRQVVQGNVINQASDQGVIISGTTTGDININHHHLSKGEQTNAGE